MKRIAWIVFTLLLLAVLAVLVVFGWTYFGPRGSQIQISRETTFLVEPISADGYVDYHEALHSAHPVSLEDNAAAIYLRVALEDVRESCTPAAFGRICRELEVDTKPDPSVAFVPFDPERFINERVNEQSEAESHTLQVPPWNSFDQARERPWSSDEFPEIADWLSLNAGAIGLLEEGAQRSMYHCWIIESPQPIPLVQARRGFSHLFSTRAMNRLSNDDFSGAAADSDRIRRIARHTNQGGWLLSQLVAYSIDVEAFNVDRVLISQLPTREHVVLRRKQLAAFGCVSGFRETIDYGFRVEALSRIQLFDQEARGLVPNDTEAFRPSSENALVNRVNVRRIDMSSCCRKINIFCDRAVAAMDLPLMERRKELLQIDQELDTMQATMQMGSYLVSQTDLMKKAVTDSVHGFERFHAKFGENVSRYRLLDVLCAARLFQLDQGRAASSRDDLVPKYLPVWPRDGIAGEELLESRSDGKWQIYFNNPFPWEQPDDQVIPPFNSIEIGL